MIKQYWGVLLVLFSFVCVTPTWAADEAEEGTSLESLLSVLTSSSFSKKAKAVEAIAAMDDERVLPVLESMLAGDLYYRKSDDKIVLTTSAESGYQLTDALTGADLGIVGKRDVKKVATNNSLRKQLRTQIAGYKLLSKKADIRLAAADDLIKTPSPEFLEVLQGAIEKEKDNAVLKALKVARAVILLQSESEVDRIQAVKDMDGFANKHTLAMLTTLVQQNEDGSYAEPSQLVREEATAVLKGLNAMETWYKFIEDLFFGFSLGSVLLLAAVGLFAASLYNRDFTSLSLASPVYYPMPMPK